MLFFLPLKVRHWGDIICRHLVEGYEVMGHSTNGAMVRAAQHVNQLQEAGDLLVPWPIHVQRSLSPEEIETV